MNENVEVVANEETQNTEVETKVEAAKAKTQKSTVKTYSAPEKPAKKFDKKKGRKTCYS